MTAGQKRLQDARENGVAWRKWGPYLSERQRGTVREDYSDSGDPILFYGCFHGDDGTGIVARVMQLFATTTPRQVLQLGKAAGVTRADAAPAAPNRKAEVREGEKRRARP